MTDAVFGGLQLQDDTSATSNARNRHLAAEGRKACRTILRIAAGGPVEGPLADDQADAARTIAAALGLDEWLRNPPPPEPEQPHHERALEHQGRRYGTGRVYGSCV